MRTLTYHVAANRCFDTVVMGRGTYEPALKAGITSPNSPRAVRRLEHAAGRRPRHPRRGRPPSLVRELKRRDGLGIWLAGGGKLAAALRDEIDELVIKRNPLVIGSGISLFEGPFRPTPFVPAWSREFDSGARIEGYARQQA